METKLSKNMRLILSILLELEQDGKKKQEGYIFVRDIYEQVYSVKGKVPNAVIVATHNTLKRLMSRGLIKKRIEPPLPKGWYRPAFILTEKGRVEAKRILSQ